MWEHGFWFSGWWLIPLLFVAVCFFMMFFMRGNRLGCMGMGHDETHGAGHGESPEDIARRRYAEGKISREEFQTILKDLSENRHEVVKSG